ncbi:hypothetical protein [Saccharothrix syringae]|uniref:hypothetical protein n=1 Tax=Saccharothrix syringae TaxID=103733 RepID=UPI000AFB1A1C|nr:hypothetical protein [Saccharothrix syringae]
MGTMILSTVLALPLAVLAARVGRRRWRRCARGELFRHRVHDPGAGSLIRP